MVHVLLVLIFVVFVEALEGDAGNNEVDDEDGRPHEDEAEPGHLEDLVHACVARHVNGDNGVEDTHGRSAKGPSTCGGRTRSAPRSSSSAS